MRWPLERIRQVAGKLSWGVADQAVSSLTNLAVAILVARSSGIEERGAFATYQVALNASRGLATDAFVVRYSGVEIPSWRRAVARSTGTAATVGWSSAPAAASPACCSPV
jgi:hypothetical protein